MSSTSSRDPSAPLHLVILGTGSSAAVPDIACVTSPGGGCACCRASRTQAGQHNVRGNTGAVLRIPQLHGREKTVLIDAGKTFREQALKLFPEHGLRQIDACILTHHHADAIDGLDDLRAWTYKAAIEATIPIYCTKTTYDHIAQGFEYLVNKAAASGSGKVPSFQWRLIEEGQPFTLFGTKITPLPVHHGTYFTSPPSPLISLAFLVDSSILYCSDVSFIPETTWSLIEQEVALPARNTNTRATNASSLPRLQALIVDTTYLSAGSSHWGLPQAVATARRLGARQTYLTDLPHRVSHECWLHCCIVLSNRRTRISKEAWMKWEEGRQQAPVSGDFDPRDEDFGLFVNMALQAVDEWEGPVGDGTEPWIRPAADGMVISCTAIGRERRVWDDLYQEHRV